MREIILAILLAPTFCFAQSFVGESVEYDPAGNRFFTSSNNTSIIQRASNGETSYFGDGLEASYGMEVMGNTLFALEGTNLYGYDLTSEEEVFSVQIAGSGFFNGLANDGVSRLWVTDFTNNRIYEVNASDFDKPMVTQVVSNTLSTPNGIYYDEDNNRLVYVTWSGGNINQVDLTDYSVSTIINAGLGSMDGIDTDSDGNYFVSSWSPLRITKFSNDFATSEIVSVSGLNSPADICYAQATDTLAIPSTSQECIFIGFGETSGVSFDSQLLNVNLFPNPVQDSAQLNVLLDENSIIEISIIDAKGSFVRQIFQGQTNTVQESVDMSKLIAGSYFIQLSVGGQISNYPFIKK